MGDYAHVTAYGSIKVGREKQALQVWSDALDFHEKAQANGSSTPTRSGCSSRPVGRCPPG